MSFYTDMATVARELLEEFGQAVTVNRDTLEDINPETFVETTPPTTTAYTPNGILKDYSDGMIDGTRIQTGDRLMILDDTIEPLAGDRLTIGGEEWNIVAWRTSDPAGTALVYFVQVRR